MKTTLLTPTQWQAAGHYFQFNGRQIFYRQSEAGKSALLLIHGFPTASWDWYRIWDRLSATFHLVATDMLGFGFSEKPRPYRYTITEQADLQEYLLRELGIRQVHILAHDYGDTVAQELLARQLSGDLSFHLQSVVFLNGGLFPGIHQPRPIQKLLMSPIGRYMTPFLGKSNLAKTFRRIFGPHTQPTEEEIDHFWELIEHQDGKMVIPLLIRYMQERTQFRDRWVGALQKSLLPMLLINGAYDPISGSHMAAHYRKIVPNARVVELKKIGHYPQIEAPLRTVDELLFFLQLGELS
jgi:pimeloyl-ACP methyl ester carboxylesterase